MTVYPGKYAYLFLLIAYMIMDNLINEFLKIRSILGYEIFRNIFLQQAPVLLKQAPDILHASMQCQSAYHAQ